MEPFETPKKRILAVVTTGGFTHAAPVLELCKVLANRGHEISFATLSGQEHWIASYPFIVQTHILGLTPTVQQEAEHYTRMLSWDPSGSFTTIMKSKYLWDSFWPATYSSLKSVMEDASTKPDYIIADFFAEQVCKDMRVEYGVGLAVMYPLIPMFMGRVGYIAGYSGFQVDDNLTSESASVFSRIRNEMLLFWALPELLKWQWWMKRMRKTMGVNYTAKSAGKPDGYLVMVNSFLGFDVARELPPGVMFVGPVLGDEFPSVDDEHRAFLESHRKVLYISLGTHITLPEDTAVKLLEGVVAALEKAHINGVIWSLPHHARKNFPLDYDIQHSNNRQFTVESLLDNKIPDILITAHSPQRAILDHAHTSLFLTHAGGSSANETLYHGTPTLSLPFFSDQLSNAARLVHCGVGLSLCKSSFSAAEICQKIAIIVEDGDGGIARDVKRMKGIARIAAKKKEVAADVIEQMLVDEQGRWVNGKEMRSPFLETADMRMSTFRAKNWDLWLCSTAGVISISWIAKLAFTGCRLWFKQARV